MEEQIFKDFIATTQKYNYDYDVVMGKFPELEGYDRQLLKDYVATAEKDKYDYETVNAKFPEFFGEKKNNDVSQVDVKASSVDGQDDAPLERQPGWLETTEFISPATQKIFDEEGGLNELNKLAEKSAKEVYDLITSTAYTQAGLGKDRLLEKERQLRAVDEANSLEQSRAQKKYDDSLMADWAAYKSNEMGMSYFEAIKGENGEVDFAQAMKDYYKDTNRPEYEKAIGIQNAEDSVVDKASTLIALAFTRFGQATGGDYVKSRLDRAIANDYSLERKGADMFAAVYRNNSEKVLSQARETLGSDFEKVEEYESAYTDIVNLDKQIERQKSSNPEIFNRIQRDSEKIKSMDERLAVSSTNVKKLQNQIEEERQINPASQVGINEYNSAIEQYNGILEERKQLSDSFNKALDSDTYGEYNSLVRKRNELSENANELYEGIAPAMLKFSEAQEKLDKDYESYENQNESLQKHPFFIGSEGRIEERKQRLRDYEEGGAKALLKENTGALGSAWFKLSRGIVETPFVLEQTLGDIKGYSAFEQMYDIAQTQTFIDDMFLPELAEQDLALSNALPNFANIMGQMSTFAVGGAATAGTKLARLGIAAPAYASQVGDNYRDGLERGMDRQTAAATSQVLSGISAMTEMIVSDVDLVKGVNKQMKDAAFKQVMKQIGKGQAINAEAVKKAVLPVIGKTLLSVPKNALSEGAEELIETGTGDLAKLALNKWQSTQGESRNQWYDASEIGDFENYKKAFLLGSMGGGAPAALSATRKLSLSNLIGRGSQTQEHMVHDMFAESLVDVAENQESLDGAIKVFGKDSVEAENLRSIANEYNNSMSLVEDTDNLSPSDKLQVASNLSEIQDLRAKEKALKSEGVTDYKAEERAKTIQALESKVFDILANNEQQGKQGAAESETTETKSQEVQPESKAAEQDRGAEQTTVEGDRATQEGSSGLTAEDAEVEQEILMEEALEDVERQGAIDQQRALDIERRKAQLEGRPMPGQEAPSEGRVRLQFGSEQDKEAARQPVEPGNRVRSAIGGRFSMPYNGRNGQESVQGELVIGQNNNVELHSDDGRIFELGKYNEMHSYGVKRLGLSPVNQDVMMNTDGTFEVDGEAYTNPYTDPEAAINRDENGDIVSVNLETANGEKRAFRGPRADAIAYNMQLAKYDQQQIEQELEQLENEDPETKQAFDEVRAAEQNAAEAEAKSDEQVEQQGTAESTETVEEAPKPKPVKAQKTPSQQKRADGLTGRLKKLRKNSGKLSPEHRQIIQALQALPIDSIPKAGNYILDFVENLVDQAEMFAKEVLKIDPSFVTRINNEIAEIEAEIETVQQGKPKPTKKPRKQTKQPNKELAEQEQIDTAVSEVENNDELTREQKIEHKKIEKQLGKARARLKRAAMPLSASATHSAMAERLNGIDPSHIDPSNSKLVEAWYQLANQVTRSLEGGGSASTLDSQSFENSFESLIDMIAENEAQKASETPGQVSEQVKEEVKEELDTYSNIDGVTLMMDRIQKKLKDC